MVVKETCARRMNPKISEKKSISVALVCMLVSLLFFNFPGKAVAGDDLQQLIKLAQKSQKVEIQLLTLQSALEKFDYIQELLRLDPLKPESLNKLIQGHRLSIGTNWETFFLQRIIQGMLLKQCKFSEIWSVWEYSRQLSSIYQSQFELSFDKNMLSLEQAAQTKFSPELFPLPLLPDFLLNYAKYMFAAGQTKIAREALERLNILEVKNAFACEIELIDLEKDTERPPLSESIKQPSSQVATIALMLFEPKGVENSNTNLGVYQQLVLKKAEKCFVNDKIVVPEDAITYLQLAASNATPIDFMPVFAGDNGYILLLVLENGETITLFGEMNKNTNQGCIFALAGNKFRILDTPECFWAVNLILKSANVFKLPAVAQAHDRKTIKIIKLGSSQNAASQTEELNKPFTGIGNPSQTFFYQAQPPDSDAMALEGMSLSVTASESSQSSFAFMRGRYGKPVEFPEPATRMLEITRQIKERVKQTIGRELQGCHVFALAGDASINREPPEERWIRAWSLRHGLPVGGELRRLLRLYRIIGAPLPETISLHMPLCFRGHFANPARLDGGYDMLSGYWFAELELLVIADFDTDTAQPLGKLAAEALGIELATSTAKIVLYDGFNFKNHGLRLAVPTTNPAMASWSAALSHNQIQETDESFFGDADKYKSFYSDSGKVCYIISEKGKLAELRWAVEPEK